MGNMGAMVLKGDSMWDKVYAGAMYTNILMVFSAISGKLAAYIMDIVGPKECPMYMMLPY